MLRLRIIESTLSIWGICRFAKSSSIKRTGTGRLPSDCLSASRMRPINACVIKRPVSGSRLRSISLTVTNRAQGVCPMEAKST